MEDDLLSAGCALAKPKAQGREPWACGLGVSRCGGIEGG